LQSSKSIIHLSFAGFRVQWESLFRILKVAALSSAQILVTNVMLIAVTAYAARFGTEALAGYGLASRMELLVYSLVLAFGAGATTMVGICVGAGRLERARLVTLVSCALAVAVFATLGLIVAVSGRSIAGLFTDVDGVLHAAAAYFHAIGFVYGFMALFTILFAAYQGWGQATAPLLAGLLRLAVVLAGGWALLQLPDARLEWLYYLVATAIVIASLTLAVVFIGWPPVRPVRIVPGAKG
jgi:Na+-driven multidrug efflux pump